MKILIVEDEVLIREGMSDYLMECGYEVFEAGDGQEALDLFHREAPDLVLLDIQLPILNGLEVLKTIRKTSSVPVSYTHLPMIREWPLLKNTALKRFIKRLMKCLKILKWIRCV